MKELKTKFDLSISAYDELFMTDEQRKEAKLPRIYNIPISEIDDFPNHPFRIRKDEDMELLKESLLETGIITPVIVRQKEDGRYEMISGHRRKYAATELGFETLPCSIVDVDRDEAAVIMVDSNFQRSKIGPCEKGRALKMKMDAIKHQGMRTDLTSAPNGTKLENPNGTKFNSGDVLAKENKSSHTNIYRYIALTKLLPDLQNVVDGDLMSMVAGVEISKLDDAAQCVVLNSGNALGRYPKPAEAVAIRKAYEDGAELSKELIRDIYNGKELNKKTLDINWDRVFEYLPDGLNDEEKWQMIEKALTYYNEYLEHQKKAKENVR